MNRVTKFFVSVVLTVALIGTAFVGDFAKAEGAQETVTAVFTAEKFVIGQGFLVEPKQVTLQQGSSIADLFKKVMDEEGYSYTASEGGGFYLEGINDADNGAATIPESITGLAGYLEDWEPNEDANLEEGDYTMFSGWMFSQNGETLDDLCSTVTVQDGDVIRLQFTLIWGSDIGLGDETWTGIPNAELADKEELIRTAANINSLENADEEIKTVYEKAIQALENYDATQQEIDEIYAKLKELESNPAEPSTKEPESIPAESGTKEPESAPAETSTKEPESAPAETSTKEPESTPAESSTKEPESAPAETSTKEPESAPAETSTKEPESTPAESSTKEPESTPAETSTKEPESTPAEVSTTTREGNEQTQGAIQTGAQNQNVAATTTANIAQKTTATDVTNSRLSVFKKSGKPKIKKITKKKSAKKAMIILKEKINGADGYQVRFYKTRKAAKKNKKAVAKIFYKKNKKKFTVSSTKIKNRKKLFVRTRAYCVNHGKKQYGKWSDSYTVQVVK